MHYCETHTWSVFTDCESRICLPSFNIFLRFPMPSSVAILELLCVINTTLSAQYCQNRRHKPTMSLHWLQFPCGVMKTFLHFCSLGCLCFRGKAFYFSHSTWEFLKVVRKWESWSSTLFCRPYQVLRSYFILFGSCVSVIFFYFSLVIYPRYCISCFVFFLFSYICNFHCIFTVSLYFAILLSSDCSFLIYYLQCFHKSIALVTSSFFTLLNHICYPELLL